MKKQYSFAVIGSGAAGMTAALTAAQAGKSVLLIDRMPHPARKLLMTGGGKCNFSNTHICADRYLSRNPHFCKSALASLTTKNITDCFAAHHMAFSEKDNGKLFLTSASVLHDFFFRELRAANVDFLFGQNVCDIRAGNGAFAIETETETVTTTNLLIATGGLSYPSTGATDFAFQTAKKFGLAVVEPAPALSPLLFPQTTAVDFSNMQGVSANVRMKTGKKVVTGPLLFTHDGISGPAALQTSLYWASETPVTVDFMPEVSVFEKFKALKQMHDDRKVNHVLYPVLPKRLADCFIDTLPEAKRSARLVEISDKDLNALAQKINAFSFTPSDIGGYDKAEVTHGGVDTTFLSSKTLEAATVKGLYFAGECVDVTGEVGGFNLHWAFASGTAVGRAVAATENEQ